MIPVSLICAFQCSLILFSSFMVNCEWKPLRKIIKVTTVDSRVRGHLDNYNWPFILVWHGLLARCLLHKTHPEMQPLAILYTGQY